MKLNDAGLALIKSFEGCKLHSYDDPLKPGLWTVGYGCTGSNIGPGMTITQDEADQMLLDKLVQFENGVSKLVTVDLTDNQFAALVAFSYNLGLGSLKSSHLLIKTNAGDFDGAADEFLKWDRAGGKEITGLKRRRAAERALYLQA